MTRRMLGTSRFLIILAVVGTFLLSAVLMIGGITRVVRVMGTVLEAVFNGTEIGKALIVEAVNDIDIFLLGTVLYIVSAGLYQLFIDPSLEMPGWLNIRTLDDLKGRIIVVIVVALLVAFLGYAIEWTGGTDILAIGLAIAAVVFAATFALRQIDRPNEPDDRPPG